MPRVYRGPAGLFALLIAGQSLAADAPPDTSVIFQSFRTYAREDTLALPTFIYGKWIDVEATRVSLDEILRRSIDAEKQTLRGVNDLQCTVVEKTVEFYGEPTDSTAKRKVTEEVSRLYRKQPDLNRTVSFSRREYEVKNGKRSAVPSDQDQEVSVRIGSAKHKLSSLPFFFEDLSSYDFAIEERTDLEDRVLYRIRFDPTSDFRPLPSGYFWVDTTDFRIFHTELWFEKNVPIPIVLKNVEHFAIEMDKREGHWVPARIAGRFRLRDIPLIRIPKIVDIVVDYSDYVFNPGLDARLFEEEP